MQESFPSPSVPSPEKPERKVEKEPISFEAIRERIAQAPLTRSLSLVAERPGPGQLTPEEITSLDPEGHRDSDFASAALISAFVNQGKFTREQFIDYVTDEDAENQPRCQTTLDRMLEAGVLEERGGKIFSNVDLSRK